MATKPAKPRKPRATAAKSPPRRKAPPRKAAPAASAAPSRPGAGRLVGLTALAAAATAALAIGAGLLAGVRRILAPGDAGHDAPDLALDRPRPGPDDRAPEAFRPDPTAAVPAAEREGLRPATGPLPSLVRDEAVERDTVH